MQTPYASKRFPINAGSITAHGAGAVKLGEKAKKADRPTNGVGSPVRPTGIRVW